MFANYTSYPVMKCHCCSRYEQIGHYKRKFTALTRHIFVPVPSQDMDF